MADLYNPLAGVRGGARTYNDLLASRPGSRDAFAQQLMQMLSGVKLNAPGPQAPLDPNMDPSMGPLMPPSYQADILDQLFGAGNYRVNQNLFNQPGYSFDSGQLRDPYQSNNHVGRWLGQIDANGNLGGLRWENDSTTGGFVDRIGEFANDWGPALVLAAATAGAGGFAGLGGGGVGAGAIEGAVGIPELGLVPQTGLGAGGVGAAEIAAAAGLPELGLVPQTGLGGAGWAAPISASPISSLGPAATWGDKLTYLTQGLGGAAAGAAGAGGSSWLTQAARLAPLAGLALGGKPSLPNPPATDPQANIDAGVKSINDLFANDKRAPIYKQVYDDSYGLQSSRLDENRQDTLRKLRFGLARGGLTGGSADVNAHGLEQREFGRALSDASTAAQGQADQVRANDEKTRLNLIAQMRAGLDSADATQSALTQMADNANAARAQTRYDALDSYMGAVAPTINNFQVRSGQQAAQQLYNTRFPQNRISLSGRSGTIVG